jgi:hypothetical protein
MIQQVTPRSGSSLSGQMHSLPNIEAENGMYAKMAVLAETMSKVA